MKKVLHLSVVVLLMIFSKCIEGQCEAAQAALLSSTSSIVLSAPAAAIPESSATGALKTPSITPEKETLLTPSNPEISTNIPPKIFFNDDEFISEEPLMIKGGNVFIPLTDTLAQALDAELETRIIDGMTAARFVNFDADMEFKEGESFFYLAQAKKELAKPSFSFGGILYVPAPVFFKALGCDVMYRDEAIYIKKGFQRSSNEGIPDNFLNKTMSSAQSKTSEITKEKPVAAVTKNQISYTFENKISFENVQVTGLRAASTMTPLTEYYNDFNIRFQGTFSNGYEMQTTIKTSETTDRTRNQGELKKFGVSYYNEKITVNAYDLSLKSSRYTFKNYQTQGVQYQRIQKPYTWFLVYGQTPKDFKESQYKRYINGFRIDKDAVKKGYKLGFAYASLRDGGLSEESDRLNNRVYSINAALKTESAVISSEFARSETTIRNSQRIKGNAHYADYNFKKNKDKITANYERVGVFFDSETSSTQAGKREFSGLYDRKLTPTAAFGGGYRTSLSNGESRMVFPLTFSTLPFARQRPSMKVQLDRQFERTRSADGTRLTDKRALAFNEKFGSMIFRYNYEKKDQKDSFGSIITKRTNRYRADSPLTKTLDMSLQAKNELKSKGTKPLSRSCQAKFIYALSEWMELSLGLERFYNGTTSDRNASSLSLTKIDIIKNREMNLEYKFFNYRDYNNNALRLSFSFLK